MKIGFVGLGAMGSKMAEALLAAGHELTVYNRSRERAAPLAAQGAHVGDSPAEAARNGEVVFSMLADDAAVESTCFGDAGISAGLAAGAVHVSSSTISVALSERLARAHAEAKQGYVAAPVFGRPEAAAAKQLWVLAAGAPEGLEKALPALQALGRGITRLGDSAPAANIVKLTGNFMIATMIEALGEAFAFTRKAGVPPEALLDVYANVFARAPIFENYAKLIAREAYEPPGFKLGLGLKDIRLALAAGEELEVPLPIASLLRDHFLTALASGKGELDWSAIAQVAAERAGLSEHAGKRRS